MGQGEGEQDPGLGRVQITSGDQAQGAVRDGAIARHDGVGDPRGAHDGDARGGDLRERLPQVKRHVAGAVSDVHDPLRSGLDVRCLLYTSRCV